MFNWLYWIFGKILLGIDWVIFHTLGIHNIGLCIILFTFVVYFLMYPLNSKQQKSSRLMSRVNPEIQAIQKKYKGKTDQASRLKQNDETQAVYAKYGISPFGGCLPLLVTFPVMFCLYRVMYSIKDYVPALAEPDAKNFLGLDVELSPLQFFNDKANHPYGWIAFIVPVLAVVFQFINTKIIQPNNSAPNGDQMGNSMKMMNYFMPLMSGFFCLSLNMGIGLYWIAGSLFRIVQAIIVNKKIDKISLDELIEANKEKAAKKNKKREERNAQMEQYAKTRTSSIKSVSSYKNDANKNDADKDEDSSDVHDKTPSSAKNLNVNKDIPQGSISGYAKMLSGKNRDK